MVILITGSSHTGKTLLAQRLLEHYKYPYLSLDHLKMGLIRSGYCTLTPESSNQDITSYLWPIVQEIIKTNIENNQNIIIEGCYLPFDYKNSFKAKHLQQIKFICLIFSKQYIEESFQDIVSHANTIETRMHNDIPTPANLIAENEHNLRLCTQHRCKFRLIHQQYDLSLPI